MLYRINSPKARTSNIFVDELNFDPRSRSTKSPRVNYVINHYHGKSCVFTSGSVAFLPENPNDLHDLLRRIIQENDDSSELVEDIVALIDKLLEHEYITSNN